MPAPPTHAWQLEDDSAAAYEAYLVPALFAGWARRLVAHAGVGPGQRVLDLGCGTGIVARTAAAAVGPGGRVVGLDLNEGMLAAARRASAGLQPAVEWRRGDATAPDLPDGAFDAVLAQEVLQFLPDRPAALAGARRVLAPGGRLGLSMLAPLAEHPAYAALAGVLARHLGPEAGAGMRSPFLEAGGPGMLRDLVARAGFREVAVRRDVTTGRYPSPEEMLRREAASSPLAGAVRALGPRRREALLGDVAGALAPFTDDEGVVLPFTTHLVTARR